MVRIYFRIVSSFLVETKFTSRLYHYFQIRSTFTTINLKGVIKKKLATNSSVHSACWSISVGIKAGAIEITISVSAHSIIRAISVVRDTFIVFWNGIALIGTLYSSQSSNPNQIVIILSVLRRSRAYLSCLASGQHNLPLRRNVSSVAGRLRHRVRFDRPVIEPKTSSADSDVFTHYANLQVFCQIFVFCHIFILLPRESDQSAITSWLRSCQPPVCHTKIWESR